VIVKGKVLSVMRNKAHSADAGTHGAEDSSAASVAGASSLGVQRSGSAPGMQRSTTACSFSSETDFLLEPQPSGSRPRAATMGAAQAMADGDGDDDDDDDGDDDED